MNLSLQDLRTLSDSLHTIHDDRPAWLKAMPYAMEEIHHYYRLLWEIVKRYKPEYVLEIGIDKGGSTLTLAAANPAATVVSVDIDKASCDRARQLAGDHGLKNLIVTCDDSLKNIALLEKIRKKADLLFLDGCHDFAHAYPEYEQYRAFMKDGGIILFDDIHESRQMEVAWDYVVDQKCELPRAHHSGFGACKVNHSVTCPTFSSIVAQATARFQ